MLFCRPVCSVDMARRTWRGQPRLGIARGLCKKLEWFGQNESQDHFLLWAFHAARAGNAAEEHHVGKSVGKGLSFSTNAFGANPF